MDNGSGLAHINMTVTKPTMAIQSRSDNDTLRSIAKRCNKLQKDKIKLIIRTTWNNRTQQALHRRKFATTHKDLECNVEAMNLLARVKEEV